MIEIADPAEGTSEVGPGARAYMPAYVARRNSERGTARIDGTARVSNAAIVRARMTGTDRRKGEVCTAGATDVFAVLVPLITLCSIPGN